MIEITLKKRLYSPTGGMDLALEFTVEKNSLTTLYGKSGTGKTTSLKILSGLVLPDNGIITVHGKVWLDTKKGIALPPQKRSIGFLFQDYGLFPNMTVLENIQFALKKGESQKIIKELLEIIELQGLQHHKPNALSGGQQQRVALARALAQRPELLLLDEPLAALDQETRAKLQRYILQVHQEYGLTTILVSHDIPEILKLSNHVLILKEGRITKQGSPATVFGSKQTASHTEESRDGIQLTAEIMAITTKNNTTILLTVLVGNDLITITSTKKETITMAIGDQIIISFDTSHPRIQKMN